MRLLVYVEPLIEMGLPYWKSAWSNTFGRNLIETIRRDE